MPFGLKTARATYQRAVQNVFDNMLHKNVERYVDDLLVKSRRKADHPQDLRMVFERLRQYQLKMNPLKCAFGVASGKFLFFVVRRHGIEIEQAKIDTITTLPEPRNIHELKSLQGKFTYLRHFISNLENKCQPFSRLMKKGTPFQWDVECSATFQKVKKYLMSPLVLAALIQGKPLILFVAAQEQSFEITYVPQKAVEGKILADFLADHPLPAEWELSDDLPDEDVMSIEIRQPWKRYFDGATHQEGVGAGVVFITLQQDMLP
ncbi:hypothetical protein LIER_38052 [Lithospermum erythrorhizon]|uniref:Reverse transcriptase domain-containing protein n=1 Tax=Lithospermum erythrorhizon TaxID=34254 RepID=A0AAV3PZ59_LITER